MWRSGLELGRAGQQFRLLFYRRHRVGGTFAEHYRGQLLVSVADPADAASMVELEPEAPSGTNRRRLYVFANPEAGQALLVAHLDNLGKGASGAAEQNLNLMLGLDPEAGLGEGLTEAP